MASITEVFPYPYRHGESAQNLAEQHNKTPARLYAAFWVLSKVIEEPFFTSQAVYWTRIPSGLLQPQFEDFCFSGLLSRPREDMVNYYQRVNSDGWQTYIDIRNEVVVYPPEPHN